MKCQLCSRVSVGCNPLLSKLVRQVLVKTILLEQIQFQDRLLLFSVSAQFSLADWSLVPGFLYCMCCLWVGGTEVMSSSPFSWLCTKINGLASRTVWKCGALDQCELVTLFKGIIQLSLGLVSTLSSLLSTWDKVLRTAYCRLFF